jgi:hypothetical protein
MGFHTFFSSFFSSPVFLFCCPVFCFLFFSFFPLLTSTPLLLLFLFVAIHPLTITSLLFHPTKCRYHSIFAFVFIFFCFMRSSPLSFLQNHYILPMTILSPFEITYCAYTILKLITNPYPLHPPSTFPSFSFVLSLPVLFFFFLFVFCLIFIVLYFPSPYQPSLLLLYQKNETLFAETRLQHTLKYS